MNLQTDSFPQFRYLPKEIRLRIWEVAFNALPRDRLITLWDHLTSTEPVNLPQPKHLANDRLPLLHTCIESRSIVLPKLTSAFGIPTPGYHYAGPNEQEFVSGFLAQQGFPSQSEEIPRLLESMLVHYKAALPMEEACKQHPSVFKLGSPFPRLEPAMWFDFRNDFLLIPISRGRKMTTTAPRWTMCGTLLAARVRRLAFEMSREDWAWVVPTEHSIFPLIWSPSLETGEVDFAALKSVEEICLWTREGCEVCHFVVDGKNLLQPGQWSFSLDTEEDIFKERLESRWSNVTWRVAFGRDGEKNLCEMLRDWKPHASGWLRDKISATRGVEGLGKAWKEHVEEKMQRISMDGLGTLQLLENGDGKTYLGPSF